MDFDDRILIAAKAVALANGDNFKHAFKNEERRAAKRGIVNGKARPGAMPLQSDYIAMAIAAVRAFERAK